ncbi:MAG: hypothetical protein EA368_03370 [Leptolyngbya sp. DLM2.Bin27]|nr:MAG: hypothetical protein EA368_03370 [Leptolyngbya sp. DLM2.Bin27]
MNRFIIGGILAAIVIGLTGGLGRIFTDTNARQEGAGQTTAGQNNGAAGDLGSLPIEQAGQLARRQSEVGNNGVGITSDFLGQDPVGIPPGGRPDISPPAAGQTGTAGMTGSNGNVIPRTGETATFPTTGGDIAPIQPGLVQPGVDLQRPSDPDLDSIPALW